MIVIDVDPVVMPATNITPACLVLPVFASESLAHVALTFPGLPQSEWHVGIPEAKLFLFSESLPHYLLTIVESFISVIFFSFQELFITLCMFLSFSGILFMNALSSLSPCILLTAVLTALS